MNYKNTLNISPLALMSGVMKEKGLTCRALAKITGMDETNLSKLLNGKMKISFKNAMLLSAALDIDVYHLVSISEDEKRRLILVQKKAAKFAA